MCEELNLDVFVEHIRSRADDIKDSLKKRGKNFQRLDIFDVEPVKAGVPSYTTEIKYFRLSELHDMCMASNRMLLEAKRDNNCDVSLKIEPILKEIESGEVHIPTFVRTDTGLTINDGIHRIYSLYHIFKDENPEIPILILGIKT